ncbi:LexA family protein [Acetobacterium sp.]|uniref:LexA family protein n=1 Tax=Acetobacterium sp. TaxID=1872094 RepID=UPI002F3E2CE7
MNFADRLKLLRNENALTQLDLSKKLGVSKSSIGMYESGQRVPDVETFEVIADYFNVDMGYLRGKTDVRQYSSLAPIKIPILGNVAAGVPIEAIEDIKGYIEITEDLAKKGTYFALEIKGESMAPFMLEHDVILIRKQKIIENDEIGIIMVNGDNATVKKIMKHDGGITLIPLNPMFSLIDYSCEEVENLPVEIIGKVIEIRRKV